jgi:uncharacterized protein DUF4129
MLKYRWLAPAVLILAGQLLTASVLAAPSALPVDEYWRRVAATQALASDLKDAPPGKVRAELSAEADHWAAVTEVVLSDGTRLPLDTGFIVSRLRADPPDLKQLDAWLSALLSAHSAWPRPRHSAQDLKDLALILARPEFQWQPRQPSWLEKWWQDIQDRFWRFVARLLGSSSVTADGSFITYALTGIGILALVLVLAFALRGVLANFVAEAEAAADAEASGERLTADSALQRAQTLSAAGDYRTAVRYLYLSSLLLLEERGLLRYDRSLTNREYLRSVANLPELAPILRDVVEVFDRVWYGYQALDAAAYTDYANRVADLRRQK